MSETKQIDKKQLIEELNEDLALEYRSILQYVQHIATVKGARYQQLLKEIEHHLAQELEHATTLAKQIDFLGGVPTGEVAEFTPDQHNEAALEQDLSLEEAQLQRYRERMEHAESLGLPDVSEALAPLLEQTQDHVRELRVALDR
jgi:bacterioferritin